MNSKLIPLIFLSVIFSIPAIAVQSAYAGIEEGGGGACEGDNVYNSPDGYITISPLRGCSDAFNENPVFYYGDDLTITFAGDNFCGGPGQAVSVRLLDSSFSDENAFDGGFGGVEAIDEVAPPGFLTFLQPVYAAVVTVLPEFMDDSDDDGIYSITVNLFDQHGAGNLEFDVQCQDSGLSNSAYPGPPIFLDPSGTILNACTNQPIQGATVTLFDNIGNPGNPATQVSSTGFVDIDPPNGFFSLIMAPQTNPQFTPADGAYGWLVIPSPDVDGDTNPDIPQILWKVSASAPGFAPQTKPVGNGFAIPPEVVGLNFLLVPDAGCPDIIGGEIISIDSTSLLLAGVSSVSMWLVTLAGIAGVGLLAYKLRK